MSSDATERAKSTLAAGDFRGAEQLAREAIATHADDGEAWNTLGTALARAGDRRGAAEAFRRATELTPDDHRPLSNLAAILRGAGELDEARTLLERARHLAPDSPKVLTNLGNVLLALGRHAEAISAYRRSLAIEPSLAAHRNLGRLAQEQGDLDLALEQLEIAHRLAPGDLGLLADVATLAARTGQLERARALVAESVPRLETLEAALAAGRFAASLGFSAECEQAAERALEFEPGCAEAALLLAHAYASTGRIADAERRLSALSSSSDSEPLHLELARLRRLLSDADGAQAALQSWLARSPGSSAARVMLAEEAARRGEHEHARQLAEQAVALAPDDPTALSTLAVFELRRRRDDLGLGALRRAMALAPRRVAVHSNYLYALHFTDDHDPDELYAEHLRFGAKFDHPLPIRRAAPRFDPDRRLKIAYLSPDFRDHSVARFVEPLLRAHDRSRFDVVCYSTAESPDDTTTRLAALDVSFRDVRGLSTFALAQTIADDDVDVLVELTGHTAQHRLRVMASRPAPLQLSYLGYPNTTGLRSIDLRITDAVADPPGRSDERATERLLRLPESAWTYASGSEIELPVFPSPGRLVLASYNNLRKVTPRMLGIWAQILGARSDTAIRFKSNLLGDPESRESFLDDCTRAGLDPDRLELLGWADSRDAHLATYEGVALGLDTFPYHGTTTTMDALWMGVPVVVLEGASHVSRVGVSLLRALGLGDLVATSPEDYVDRALRLLDDRARREELHRTMRARILQSVLGDGPRFTAQLETAIRGAWRNRCALHAASMGPEPDERIVGLPSGPRLVCPDDPRSRELGAAIDVADATRLTLELPQLLAHGESLVDAAGDGFARSAVALAAGHPVLYFANDENDARRARASATSSVLEGLEVSLEQDPSGRLRALKRLCPGGLRLRSDAAGRALLERAGRSIAALGASIQLEPTTPSELAWSARLLEESGMRLARSGPTALFTLGAEPPESASPLFAIPPARAAQLEAAGRLSPQYSNARSIDPPMREPLLRLHERGVLRGPIHRALQPSVHDLDALAALGAEPGVGHAAELERAHQVAELVLASRRDPLTLSLSARTSIETGRFRRALELVLQFDDMPDTEDFASVCSMLPHYDGLQGDLDRWFRAQLSEARVRLSARSCVELPDEALGWLDRCQALGVASLDLDRRLGLLSARLDAFDA